MKNLFFIILITFCSAKSYSQVSTLQESSPNLLDNPLNMAIVTFDNLKGVTGSPFITDFELGKILGYNENYFLRFDAYNDQMQIKDNNDQIVIINKDRIKKVTFNNGSEYRVFNYVLSDIEKNGYLKVVYEGANTTLLKKEVVKFYPAKRAESGYDQSAVASYKRANDIFFLLENKNGSIRSFVKKNDFVKLFSEKKSEIEKFIKSNKIKFTKEKSLIELITYINSINQ